ncbi:SWI/SNF-related matrix-associated actin-dependent regulator of chromatin subfamily A-like protein 1 [Lineus longissimus]|uniref:SWI/SNF-related matrix-associated actin-dependent regulator of chromatin subfamily A-like protein 1 n=1 Tax=Lineus longissimus TaxID=88925 RepID=UPI00315D9238
MGDSVKLTAEQRQRIEANRQKALLKRAAKNATTTYSPLASAPISARIAGSSSVPFHSSAKAAPSVSSVATSNSNRDSVISSSNCATVTIPPKDQTRSSASFGNTNGKGNSMPFVTSFKSVNTCVTGLPSKPSDISTQQLRTQQEIDARRQKALALRAQRNAPQIRGETLFKGTTAPSTSVLPKENFYSRPSSNATATCTPKTYTPGANQTKGTNDTRLQQNECTEKVSKPIPQQSNAFSAFGYKPGDHNPGTTNSVSFGGKGNTQYQQHTSFPNKWNKPNKYVQTVAGRGAGKGMRPEEVAMTLGNNAPAFHQQKSTVKGTCCLISRERFEVNILYHPAVIEIFKSMPTRCYDATSKHWTFKLGDYYSLTEKLRRVDGVTVEALPAMVRAVFSTQLGGKYPPVHIPVADLSNVEESLVQTLMPFQREGVSFAISRKGRVLLADDMGLGKTLQGICLACYYREEWPVLVVTPSSVRFAWAQQFKKWMPSLDAADIKVAVTTSDNESFGRIHITSYDLVVRKAEDILKARFRVVIMDESHLLKNHKTARCQAAAPILKAASRVILLSGTPALSRPKELFPQLSAVNSKVFDKFHDFGVRYCDGKQTQFANAWDYSGSSNMAELQLILEESNMIRRVKTDVLDQLPEKRREMIILDPAAIKTAKTMKAAADLMGSGKLKGMERRGCLLTYYAETSKAKIPAVKSYVLDLLESGKKFLVFAHHSEMLDALEDAISRKNHGLIRIDGRTPSEQRKVVCDKFMFNEDIKVALLSITAASTGLNLTAASLVVFAELFWNPGILTQAEDRVHRIGQKDSVNVQYLMAKGTADDYIWPLVQNKLDVLQSAGLTKDDFTTADKTEMGVSKRHVTQRTILSYFEEDLFDQSHDLNDDLFKTAFDDDMILMQNREGVIPLKDEETAAPLVKKPKIPPAPERSSTILPDEFDMDNEDWWM